MTTTARPAQSSSNARDRSAPGPTSALAAFSRRLPDAFIARVLGVLGFVALGFLAFTIFTSNPFARHLPALADGADLNPILQDPGLIMHPPMLYMGYVGFSVAFGLVTLAVLLLALPAMMRGALRFRLGNTS